MPNPEISKITLPSGTTYDIKDAKARELLTGALHYKGYTTTALTDGATTNPIIIDDGESGTSYTAVSGDIVIYDNGTKELEFIFNGTQWNEFGSTGTLKALAFKDNASGSYTKPTGSGSVTINKYTTTTKKLSTATVSVGKTAGSVTPGSDVSFTANTPTTIDTSKFSGGSFTAGTFSQGTLPELTTSVSNETLTISFSQGTLPTHGSDSFTAASLASGFYSEGSAATLSGGVATVVTLPTFENATVATGSLEAGDQLVEAVSADTESATVTVGTTTDTITVS